MPSEFLNEVIAGSAGGFASKMFDYPADTVKVLLQTSTTATAGATTVERPVYRGAWDCLTHTVRKHGILALYRGISSPLFGCVAENAVLFWAYSHCRRLLGEGAPSANDKHTGHELSLWELSLAGAGAGAVVSFVLTPVELVKCRMQVQNSASGTHFRSFRGPLDVIVQTVRTEGIVRGLFRGHVSTMCREIPGNFIFFAVYEATCKAMIPSGGTKEDLTPAAHILGGILSGTAYWTAFYPVDTIKSLMQTHPSYASLTFRESSLLVFRTQGLAGLYRGLNVTLVKAAPSTALIFACYEYTMKLMSS